LKKGQVKENLATHGNCIAASIPLVLFDSVAKGEIKRGDTCLLIGTSAGFSIGALLLKY
jgi:3-oxoacyl-[acyl-carrier-protein] synthase-3